MIDQHVSQAYNTVENYTPTHHTVSELRIREAKENRLLCIFSEIP